MISQTLRWHILPITSLKPLSQGFYIVYTLFHENIRNLLFYVAQYILQRSLKKSTVENIKNETISSQGNYKP